MSSPSNNAQTELEIVQLSSGEIVLRRSDDGEKKGPLVTIQFSDEAKGYLGGAIGDIGKAMIDAGVEMAGAIQEKLEQTFSAVDALERVKMNDKDLDPNRVLH